MISVTENSNKCDLIPISQTQPINPYAFGGEAKADTCEIHEITCIYDDSFSPSGSNPRFFESGSINAFFLTKEPQDVYTWQSNNYADTDVINI